MFRLALVCVGLTAGVVAAAEPSKVELKKLATSLGEATMAGNATAVVEGTYPTVVETMGGKTKAVELIRTALKKMKDSGLSIKKYEVGEPGDFLKEGANTFSVVPSALEMATPSGQVRVRGYLLAISPDGGKTWTFADGSGLQQKAARDKVLPKLPAGLKLPEPSKPELIKN